MKATHMAQQTMRYNKIPLVRRMLCLCLVAAIAFSSTLAETQEYRVKAALLYKLTKFISWPEAALSQHTHFGICILGEDKFGSAIEELSTRSTKGKPIKILRFQQSQSIDSQCQVLFIEASKLRFWTASSALLHLIPS